MTVANPTYQTAVGLGIEVTPGTIVAPTLWLPTTAPKPSDDIKYYEDKAYRGIPASTFGHYGMAGSGSFGVDGPFYPDAPGALLAGAMGADATTTNPATATATPAVTAGSSTITFTGSVPTGYVAGMAILIDTTGVPEGNIIQGIAALVVTLVSPLRFSHGAGWTLAANTMHTLTLGGTPPTFSVYDRYISSPSNLQRDYAYGTVSEFDINWSADAECTYSGTLTTLLSATTSNTASSYTSVPPFVGWQSGFISNGAQQTNLMSAKLAFKRTVTPIFSANNSQSPTQILATELDVSGSASFYVSTDTEYNWFRNGTVQPLQLGIFGPAPGAQGTLGAAGLLFQATRPTFTKGTFDRSKEFVQVQLDFSCDYNSTDAGNAKCWLTNAVTAVY